ncbi:MAG: adenylyl-sulfate kinase [Leptospirales bacterium]|nr:adenylyl-sulfate kinase [Leptospirales bacterium]
MKLKKNLTWGVIVSIALACFVLANRGTHDYSAVLLSGVGLVLILAYALHEWFWSRSSRRPIAKVIWLTGLSGAGKSTLANLLVDAIRRRGLPVELLDGDQVRSIFPNTGFSREDRIGHVKRVGFLASLLQKNGVFVVASFISPYRESRDFVRGLCSEFVEVYLSTPLEVCEKRDVKGLYQKARAGEIQHFTGIDDPYETPEKPELVIDTSQFSESVALGKILEYVRI